MDLRVQSIARLLNLADSHETRAHRSINFTPSENVLSPLARMPFISDIYARYFFDYFRHSFISALDAGRIQMEILDPLLQEMTHAQYVETRPISGMNCATIAIAALCPIGGKMLTVSDENGGHSSTDAVAGRLGIRVAPMPMRETHFVDLAELDKRMTASSPNLIYLDQSSMLFPIDPQPIREIIDRKSPRTLLHVDSSHTNGLIIGGAIPNPLDRGAHSFGGSTHKTLPGPHKGFLATNDRGLMNKINDVAYHFISQHHLAAALSLAITLLEMRDCGGTEYATRVIDNTALFAQGLSDQGIPVTRTARGFTACHQTWIQPVPGVDAEIVAKQLYDQGLLVNLFRKLPGVEGPALRMSMAEMTRLGGTQEDVKQLIRIFAASLKGERCSYEQEVGAIRTRLSRPRYCYKSDELLDKGIDPKFLELLRCLEKYV